MKNHTIDHAITTAKNASRTLLTLTKRDRTQILLHIMHALHDHITQIIAANKKDQKIARAQKLPESFIERLSLDAQKIHTISLSVKTVAYAPDTLMMIMHTDKRPSGITIAKQSVPLGLIAMIYESRPNVTIDAFVMAFKSGNAIILKGGKEIQNTNRLLIKIIRTVLKDHDISPHIIQDISGIGRTASNKLLCDQRIDCLIPRGGKKLIDHVRKNATVPVIITGASVVHTYIDEHADLDLAVRIVTNAKTRRVSICNALDVILVHQKILTEFLSLLAPLMKERNVVLRADKKSYAILQKFGYRKLRKATKYDFDTEFLDLVLAIKTVSSCEKAIAHVQEHSLGHSEAIITTQRENAEKFFREIDAACLYLNTSTQFSDGGEFGMGGEIGISTQKLHARGPFAYESLTTYKYLVKSNGEVRK